MSWSLSISGKGTPLAAKIAERFGESKKYCKDNAQEVKIIEHAQAIAGEVAADDPDRPYLIEANGSFWGGAHYVKLEVRALHDFAG
jgi:hypothetical protein